MSEKTRSWETCNWPDCERGELIAENDRLREAIRQWLRKADESSRGVVLVADHELSKALRGDS